jgi:hypothetical protein
MRIFLGLVASLCLTLSATGQALTWLGEYQDPVTTDIGNAGPSRPTIASAVLNNEIFIAYTSNNCDGVGCEIKIKGSAGQNSYGGFNFDDWGGLGVTGYGWVYSKVNPAMGVQNGVVYIAWTDESGNNYLTYSTDMHTFSAPLTIPAGATMESIDLTFNPNNPGQLWLGYVSTSKSGVLCSTTPNLADFSASYVNCSTVQTSGTQMLYNPGLIWNGTTLDMFLTWQGSSHCLSSFYSATGSDPWTYWNPKSLCSAQQTSSAPDPIYYNGYLYVAFRSNDSSAAFDLIGGTVSGTTYNWSRLTTGGQHMDGSPNLLVLNTTLTGGTLYPSQLINFYARSGKLYMVAGH